MTMTKIRDQYKPAVVLATWRDLLQAIPNMNEAELLAALKVETERPKSERRADMIERLHRRYSRMRQDRELQEYLA